jgi:hypothetical protein
VNVANARDHLRMSSLLTMQRGMQAPASVTVTPGNLSLQKALDGLIATGLRSTGFSPMLGAPTGEGETQSGDFERMLGEMIDNRRQVERASRSYFRRSSEPGATGLGVEGLGVEGLGLAGAAHG